MGLFAVIVMAYHVRSDGWNPRRWKRGVNQELQHPMPVRLERGKSRIGKLELVDTENAFSKDNITSFGRLVWDWVK
jgi:hypothetical protein